MASITLDIPDAALPRVVNALCAEGGWAPDLNPPITKGAFAKRMVADMLRERVQAIETRLAREAAVAAVVTPATIEIT